MERTLTLSRRPFIVLGICLSPVIAAGGYGVGDNLMKGNWREAAAIAAIIGLLVAFVLSQLVFTKIRVTEDSVALWGWLGEKQKISFGDITFTRVNTLFEKDWPISIEIYARSQSRPAMIIRSKLLKREDIAWLLSLSALKVRD